ncbi:hypothetical protein SRHO_G00278280 [Serrasalmus rhombeus]
MPDPCSQSLYMGMELAPAWGVGMCAGWVAACVLCGSEMPAAPQALLLARSPDSAPAPVESCWQAAAEQSGHSNLTQP